MSEKTILITGYGPFGEHAINASWEAVKLIDEDEFAPLKIIKHEVPVVYKYVDENIEQFWAKYKPEFTLHVGVAAPAEGILLESIAYRTGYIKKDAEGNYHPTGEVCPPEKGPDELRPLIDVERICKELDAEDLRFFTSKDAGRYLCEYIFYTSLNVDKSRILFVHVPVLDKPYAAEELAKGLTKIINAALQQINEVKTD